MDEGVVDPFKLELATLASYHSPRKMRDVVRQEVIDLFEPVLTKCGYKLEPRKRWGDRRDMWWRRNDDPYPIHIEVSCGGQLRWSRCAYSYPAYGSGETPESLDAFLGRRTEADREHWYPELRK